MLSLARVKRLTLSGWSQRDIAARLGTHQRAVLAAQRAAMVPPAGHKSERRRAKARRHYRAVCDAFGVANLWSIPGLVRRVEAAKKGSLPC